MRIRLRNPFPPFPARPEGVEQGKWISDLEFFRPFSAYILNSLWESLTVAKVPEAALPTKDSLNVDGGIIDLVSTSLARTRVKDDPFWKSVTPERYASDTVLALFGGAAANKRAAADINTAIRVLAMRIRKEMSDAGYTALPPSRSLSTEYVTAAAAPPKPPKEKLPKPPKPARAPKPPRAPKSASAPRPAPPPSVLPPSRIPDTEAFHEAMSDRIMEAASAIGEEMPLPGEEEAPVAPSAKKRQPKRRPPSAGSVRRRTRLSDADLAADDIPRIRRLSEATLRAEREYFYSDDDGALSARECPMTRRLSGFWQYRAGIRPLEYAPPVSLLRKNYGNILLLLIPPGNLVQVYVKGALTEVFASSRTENALSIAARYANQWRGVLPDGSIAPDAKRSRLTCAILAAYYTEGGVSEPAQLAEPITEVLERDPGVRGYRMANPSTTIVRIRNPR